MEKFILKRGLLISVICICIGIAAIILFPIFSPFNDWSFKPDATLFSAYGEFIGGLVGSIFSLAGFILLYLTLQAQRDAISKQEDEIKTQRKLSEQESFETTFFNLLNIHQNITNDIVAHFIRLAADLESTKYITIKGREFFMYAIAERNKINKSLSTNKYLGVYDESDNEQFLNYINDIYASEYSGGDPFTDPVEKEKNAIENREIQVVNMFYGINENKWETGHKLVEKERVKFVYEIFFNKNQYVVGHYFRHLYHIINFVENYEESQINKDKSENEGKNKQEIKDNCYKYAQFIQAQISALELALLHDNILVFEKTKKLVDKYNLLENCSTGYLINKTNYS